MTRPPKLCLTCGKPQTYGSRCRPCTMARKKAKYGGEWSAFSRQAIANYRAIHGDRCPGWGKQPPHAITPGEWVTDHDAGPMCRACNGRKANTTDRGL